MKNPLLTNLIQLAERLGPDEQRVLVLIANRLLRGREGYGDLDLMQDHRDFAIEAMEEVADGLVYVACALMRERRA